MKKAVCILLSLCIAFSATVFCSATEIKAGNAGSRIDSFGNFMIENFDSPDFSRINICVVSQSTDDRFVSEGKASTKITPINAVGQKDKIAAGLKISVGKINLSGYGYFSLDVFSEQEFEEGSFVISFLTERDDDNGFDYTVPCKLSEGLNKIVFKKTQITVKDKTADWSNISGIKIAWINDLDQNVKPTLYLDNFFAVSEKYLDILDGRLSEYAFGDGDRNLTVNAADALLTLQSTVGISRLDDGQVMLCDVDGNGQVTANDALTILQYTVGAVERFEVGERPVIGSGSKYFSSSFPLEKGKSYAVDEYKQILNFKTPDPNYTNIQGGYFDGTKFVCALTRGSMRQNNEVGIIAEYDKNGKVIRWSEQLNIEHGNNVTFVPKLNAYLVSHCQPGWNVYSLIDADTLKEVSSGSLERDFFSMAYSPVLDKYASGFSAGQKVHTWNGDLTLLNEYDVAQPSSLSQGVFCDSEHIYFIRSHAGGDTFSELRVYNWDGELEFQIDMPEWNSWSPEPEGINVIDGKVYVIARQNGITVYEITFKEKA